MRHELMCICYLKLEGLYIYKIELRIQIDNEDFMHDTNQYEFKMDGQDKDRGPRGVFQEATQALAWGEQGNRYGSKYWRSQSHGELYVEECHHFEKGSDLGIKDGFHSYMKEDSKSLAQAGMLTEFKDVGNLKILIEEVRLDQDMKTQVLCVCSFM